jgi:hypothetical protein
MHTLHMFVVELGGQEEWPCHLIVRRLEMKTFVFGR